MAMEAMFDRNHHLARLAQEDFDVLVVGGGITGAGVALDASVRGLKVALVERNDWASGTSSKSSKLIHGGLRYLNQREFRLVREALRERARLRRNAVHLVRPLGFLIPLFGKDGLINPRLAKAVNSVLWLYDLSGGWRIGKLHRSIGADETCALLPTLKKELVQGGFLYWDAQADDARLTLAVVQTAAQHGAVVVNHCEVVAIDGNTTTVRPSIGRTDEIVLKAKTIVNATGVWADSISNLASQSSAKSIDQQTLRPAKGVHISVPIDRLDNDIAVVLPVRGTKRSIFVVPIGQHTYIGTTDNDYEGSLDTPLCTSEEVDELIAAVNGWTSQPLTRADVSSTWAGLRPLLATHSEGPTADLSRRHRVSVSDDGIITITGGKLTTYRRMATDTVDVVMHRLDRGAMRRARRRTRSLPLWGSQDFPKLAESTTPETLGTTPEIYQHLLHRYGDVTPQVLELVREDPRLGEPLLQGLPYLCAEAIFAVRHEMACDLDDVLNRRVPARWLDARATFAGATRTAELIGPLLGWSRDECNHQASAFRDSVNHQLEIAGLTPMSSSTDTADTQL